MRIALFPGSFDPFTLGHEALVGEALALFDRVVVAIGANPDKAGMFSIEERKAQIEQFYKDNKRVEVTVYEGLTGDYARERGIDIVVRGARNATDFEYERQLMLINQRLYPELHTVILFTKPELAAISSSVVREVLRYGGDVSNLLPQKK